jgi:hypothetical protein
MAKAKRKNKTEKEILFGKVVAAFENNCGSNIHGLCLKMCFYREPCSRCPCNEKIYFRNSLHGILEDFNVQAKK